MVTSLRAMSKNDSSTSVASATGNPRNKVALLPGYSLMDWIRLGNSGKDLTSVGGVLKDVTLEELAKHNTQERAWICLRGKVYNVTPYMNFHPGGVSELMKGVGKDATKLFTDIHPWVNYESILQKCLVGRLVKGKAPYTSDDFEKAFFDNIKLGDFKNELTSSNAESKDESFFKSNIEMCWTQTSHVINFIFQCRISSPKILVTLKPKYHLKILIEVNKKIHIYCFQTHKKVLWPCFISVNTDTGKIDLEFTKKVEGYWNTYGTDGENHGIMTSSVDEMEAYHQARIISINQLTHNVRTFVFEFVDKVMMWVPIGHDVRIRGVIEGIDYAKRYTPIPPYLPHGEPTVTHWHHSYLCFMVKYYSNGAFTPYLFGKKKQDIVEIGGISGNFNIRKLNCIKDLYLIAAGSGLSPMLRLLVWGVSKKFQIRSVKLLFVNRYEEDIIWKKELDDFAKKEKWFKVTYCLSQPRSEWKGLIGRVNDVILNDFLPQEIVNSDETCNFFICVCGPIKFTEMVQEYLNKRGFECCSHCFIG